MSVLTNPRTVKAYPSAGAATPRWAPLHCHTLASDGVFAPTELWQMARAAGIRHLALTDHNSLAGYDELRFLRDRLTWLGCSVWPGVELTVTDPEFGLHGHLTVLFPDGMYISSYDAIHRLCQKTVPERIIDELCTIPCLILSGCLGSIAHRYARQGPTRDWIPRFGAVLARWQRLFGDRLYLEVMPDFYTSYAFSYLHKHVGLPLVATCDVHGTPALPLRDAATMRGLFPDAQWQRAISQTKTIIQRLNRMESVEFGSFPILETAQVPA